MGASIARIDLARQRDWFYGRDRKMHDVPAPPRATLARAPEIAKSAGLRYVYTGNVHDEAGQSTYCYVCGERVIGRNWYEITSCALDDNGCCRSCSAQCSGVFEQGQGSWGGPADADRVGALKGHRRVHRSRIRKLLHEGRKSKSIDRRNAVSRRLRAPVRRKLRTSQK
jgi:hypothetical protein